MANEHYSFGTADRTWVEMIPKDFVFPRERVYQLENGDVVALSIPEKPLLNCNAGVYFVRWGRERDPDRPKCDSCYHDVYRAFPMYRLD